MSEPPLYPAHPYLIATGDSEEVLATRTEVSDCVHEEGLLRGGGLGRGAVLRSPAGPGEDSGVWHGGHHVPVGGGPILTQLHGVGEDRRAPVREGVACGVGESSVEWELGKHWYVE